MRLTKHSDYALRALIYAACHEDRLVSTAEISAAFGISENHLGKIVHALGRAGLLEVRRGRSGGVRLARPASAISVGEVVRSTEPDFALVECFDREHDTCPITPACALIPPLRAAMAAFMAALDGFTLADVAGPNSQAKYRRLLRVLR